MKSRIGWRVWVKSQTSVSFESEGVRSGGGARGGGAHTTYEDAVQSGPKERSPVGLDGERI